jgi:hypothetical protein
MVLGDLNYVLLFPIINNRDKCLTKYDNDMVIGDLKYELLYLVRHVSRVLVIGDSKS